MLSVSQSATVKRKPTNQHVNSAVARQRSLRHALAPRAAFKLSHPVRTDSATDPCSVASVEGLLEYRGRDSCTGPPPASGFRGTAVLPFYSRIQPKVIITFSFRSRVIVLDTFSPPPHESEEDAISHPLCPVCALSCYVGRRFIGLGV